MRCLCLFFPTPSTWSLSKHLVVIQWPVPPLGRNVLYHHSTHTSLCTLPHNAFLCCGTLRLLNPRIWLFPIHLSGPTVRRAAGAHHHPFSVADSITDSKGLYRSEFQRLRCPRVMSTSVPHRLSAVLLHQNRMEGIRGSKQVCNLKSVFST